jgi:DNA-3-methyladenine glycosylase
LAPSKRPAAQLAPDARLQFDPVALKLTEFRRDFYRRDTASVAKAILGSWFARKYQGRWFGARIVETEAYLGAIDAAAHSRGGRRTPRVEPMYHDGGHLYVFLVYGMHSCANVVTGPVGVAEAVLLRAAEGPRGAPVRLLSGPGKLCAALGITAASSGLDLLAKGEWHVFQGDGANLEIGTSMRIGVAYAGEAASWPLRFFDKESPAVSGPRRLRENSGQ